MTQPSRREFLAASAAGAAAVSVTTLGGGLLSAGPAAATPPVEAGAQAGGPVIAEVRDVAKGEIIVMAGESEVMVTDVALAARLAHLARAEA
jgi:hypothetical protein